MTSNIPIATFSLLLSLTQQQVDNLQACHIHPNTHVEGFLSWGPCSSCSPGPHNLSAELFWRPRQPGFVDVGPFLFRTTVAANDGITACTVHQRTNTVSSWGTLLPAFGLAGARMPTF